MTPPRIGASVAGMLLAVTVASGQELNYLNRSMFTHPGDPEEGYQNPAAPARSDGFTASLAGGMSSVGWTHLTVPLPGATRLAWSKVTWYDASLSTLSLSSRFGKEDTASGFLAGIAVRWNGEGQVVYDPGISWRARARNGSVLDLGAYTFALFGEEEVPPVDYYYGDDPPPLQGEAVVQAAWYSPTGFWEAGGSIQLFKTNQEKPELYRNTYPLRHLEAGIRPVPWFKLGAKQGTDGIREYHFEGAWKRARTLTNALRFRVSGYRDYQGFSALSLKFSCSFFGNWERM